MAIMESLTKFSTLIGVPVWAIAFVIAWTFIWKGLALWRAALLRQRVWFVALLLINTLGLLEIIYLFLVARRYQVLVEVIGEKE